MSNQAAGSATASSVETRSGAIRALLTCGMVAGPLFLIVTALQAATRDGFDVTRHPASFLSVGDWGWIQITNFAFTGALFIAFAVGMQRALHQGRGRTWGPLLVGTLGVGLFAGGIFVADPAFGFPPGTPEGMPDELTTHGILHGLASGIGFLSLIAACFVFARRFSSEGNRDWARISLAVGSIFLVAAVANSVAPGEAPATIGLGIALINAFLWTSALARRLRDMHARHVL